MHKYIQKQQIISQNGSKQPGKVYLLVEVIATNDIGGIQNMDPSHTLSEICDRSNVESDVEQDRQDLIETLHRFC